MPAHLYYTLTSRADSFAHLSSITSNRECWPQCRTIFTPHQPAVLTVMPDPPHFPPTSHADRYAGPFSLPIVMPDHSHSTPTGRADSYDRLMLTPFLPAVLTVTLDHPYSTPTGRVGR